ncbi:GntR family transcriptional regulator [Azospirillum brasilense]|uniref:GntR family transcriptional regulator n=2 Tax=Azospirillum TaxID=191 RepID=A0A0P0FE44_AZOBR|nr:MULTISPECIES: GntR family transcriptional regulator [Azospirillum]ALJ39238.1 GntR family transcriptional regulator [Azospirillum brasilense]MDW7556899.1 GntR family transcriptional regulator [Azospirillum brasilense]MDW7596668.1 GntR family transcriptional regulator [Azospirillum brasilense]MDW7631549.1 GntR family transcriptional regulator [Azospirillum brasilense]MDX5950336.1 GntR family transcriptional regulator [Azospirillum brasilense]
MKKAAQTSTADSGQAEGVKTRTRRRTAAAVARPAQRGTTVAATIYRDLRNEIVSLRRKPGEPVAEKVIAQDYGVSRTPVREAVLRLADEGLIEIFPQSGTFVSRIPLGALPEAIAIRKALEEATVRYAAKRATRSQIAKLRANLELQREMEAAQNFEGFHQADETFHALLAETAGYPGFWNLTQQVKVQVDRYRLLTLPVLGRVPDVIAEHSVIIEAIANNDPEAAAKAIDLHLDYLQVTIADAQKANPLYFTAPSEDEAEPV